jgi:uncharacterized Ntn-hydrolase superfamily protein
LRPTPTRIPTAALALLATAAAASSAPGRADATWSIVAVNPGSGAMGVAIASCTDSDLRHSLHVQPEVRSFGRRPARPARGALVVQASYSPTNWARAGRLLSQGLGPEEIVRRLTDPAGDPGVAVRQYAVVGPDGAVATHTGEAAAGWSGERTARGVAVLGNYLTGPLVVSQAFAAYRSAASLPLERRLVRALQAGARAGGDNRCGGDRAKSAALMVSAPRRYTFLSAITGSVGPRNAVAVLARTLPTALARNDGPLVGGSR